MSSNLLDDLVAGALEDAAVRREYVSLADIEEQAITAPAPRDALAALARGDRVKILAEVKRASPSRGPLAEIPDPVLLADEYERGGASAISVLTEQRRFKGSLDDLGAVAAATKIPVLRKDFIAEPYQVFESRAAGADLVLLIVAALDDPTLRELHELVEQLGMTALVETHTPDEVRRAADLGAKVIGVNARDLATFELDRTLFGRLVPLIPEQAIRIAESAVKTPQDVAAYRADGADVVLVGEALVTHGHPSAAIEAFRAA